MKTIYKYPLQLIDGRQVVEMPKGSVIVHAGEQSKLPCLWAMVDTEVEDKTEHTFEISGTGTPVPDAAGDEDWGYIGIAMCDPFVWHIWELFPLDLPADFDA